MTEAEFWSELEWRVTRELEGMPSKHRSALWCDGFMPIVYSISDPTPRIDGRVWIANGPEFEEWKFTLFLPRPVQTREKIEWESLIPPDHLSYFLAIDESRRKVEIEPAAARPPSA